MVGDTYATELPLLYPPYLIAVASVYIALVVDPCSAVRVDGALARRKRKRTDDTSVSASDDVLAFLARLNVSLPYVAQFTQKLLADYELWSRLRKGLGDPTSGASTIRPRAHAADIIRDHIAMFARFRRMHNARRYSLVQKYEGAA